MVTLQQEQRTVCKHCKHGRIYRKTAKLPKAQAILRTFMGKPPTNSCVVGFRDGNRRNCWLSNLYWRETRVKYPVKRMIALRKKGLNLREIAAEVGVGKTTIGNILRKGSHGTA